MVEYLRAFLTARSGWSRVNALLIVSGAFGIFRRDVLRELGGYRRETVGEDGELVVRIHRHFRERGEKYKVVLRARPGVLDRGARRRSGCCAASASAGRAACSRS